MGAEARSKWEIWDFSGLDILEASGEAALVLDRAGIVVYCNAASERLQRRPRDEIIGQALVRFSTAKDPNGPGSRVWEELLAGEHWSGEVWIHRGDGTQVPAYATRSALVAPSGDIVGVLSLATDRTTEHAAKSALVASERRFRALVQRSSDLAILFQPDGTMIYVSPSIEAVSGLQPEALLGSNGWDFVHPADLPEVRDAVSQRLAPGKPVSGEWRLVTSNGWRWFEITLTDMIDDPAVGGIVGNLRDVTDRRRALEALRTMAERFRRVFDESPVGKMIVDTQLRIVEANHSLCDGLAYPCEELQGMSIDRLVHPAEVEEQRARWAALFAGEMDRFRLHLRYRRGDGSEVVARLSASALHDEAGAALAGICEVEDVTEQVRADEELARRALTDPLTRLPNRALLHDRLSQALARLTREATVVAVLFLDIDRFKLVNDTLGHEAGDELLVAIADRLSETVRATDTVARFGGDEFVVVAEDVVDEVTVLALGDRLIEAVAAPLEVAGHTMTPSLSIGIAIASDSTANPTVMLREADLAMYRAKDAGGGQCLLEEEADKPEELPPDDAPRHWTPMSARER
ncbi:MAG TPA: PAS domain S-box protein [Acidimicrobiales bacterium]|nr:PAS domain S-box protein [Acidimicrobiales bacterium]